MKKNVINVMNFVRQIDERLPEGSDILYQTTAGELALVNKMEVENTFLLQYDVLCDPRFVRLFREQATPHTELGLWYEIVAPLTEACGIPFRSERGWKWDWHIIPGFSMAYTPVQREQLMDEAMGKFRETFGYYPKTVASWLIDTHTMNYLCAHYDVSMVAICRDQMNTDAYTLMGGYFNQAYYPSKHNIFTPAQTRSMQVDVPVFRLLGPCPIHNYDGKKYISRERGGWPPCCTMEAVWPTGADPEIFRWFLKTHYDNENLGFGYTQIGQENSFGRHDLVTPLRMQLETIRNRPDLIVEKMRDTGERFKALYPDGTPPTAVTATDNWDSADIQSVYYDCKYYTANLFRYEDRIFFRTLYRFDEQVKDRYLEQPCTTPREAVYENLPLVDCVRWLGAEKRDCGLMVDTAAVPFTVEKTGEGQLRVCWGDREVRFAPEGIRVCTPGLHLYTGSGAAMPEMSCQGNKLHYVYNSIEYTMRIDNARICPGDGGFDILPGAEGCILRPGTEKSE